MRAFKTATKEEIIEALQDLPDGASVAFSSDYGDHSHTLQLHRLKGDVEPVAITESSYSDSGFAVNDEDYPRGHVPDDVPIVYILS